MDAARSATQGAYYHPDVIYLLLLLEIKKGTRGLWYSQLDIHQLGPRLNVYVLKWISQA